MAIRYFCPKCLKSINIGNQIILTGETKTGLKGLVILNSKLGNYTSLFSDDLNIIEGNKVTLSCPICHECLSTKKDGNLAHLNMMDDKNKETTIYFSQILGEKCTYNIEDKSIIQSFGKDKELYKPDWSIEKL